MTKQQGRRMKKKAYAVAVAIQVILASTVLLSKAAFDGGLSMFVYVFYRLAAASLFLTPLAILLESQNKVFWNTLSMILYNGSLKYTSATVASAMCNSIPAITFFLALLMRCYNSIIMARELMIPASSFDNLHICTYERHHYNGRMEVIKFRSSSGMAKTAGIALCLAGVLVVALCAGRPLSPLGRHRVLASHGDRQAAEHVSKGVWIAGTFVMLLSCVGWSLWIVFQQGLLLKEYPNKLLATLIQCLFGAMQSGLVAAVAERGHPSRWKLGLDLSLVAVAYSGIVGTGACYYLQTWCVGMEGPVFLAMWNPLSLLLTVLCSSLLGETVHLGRQVSWVGFCWLGASTACSGARTRRKH
ncbi:hypothetical protein PAHAL_3G087800 [Panicum hallii]|uniref:WAT1-related protein n=1 Tax=Panicum hallii TaxID=206008 RepID=A0A2T8KHK2_9POAL|nr:hypothetical protein PAHAL_3G087800 [Panicum hallii]